MPLYDFQCRSCEYTKEVQIKMEVRDSIPVYCERCNEEMVRLSTSHGGFQLKGRCWSRDNYASCLGDDPRYKNGTYDPTKETG